MTGPMKALHKAALVLAIHFFSCHHGAAAAQSCPDVLDKSTEVDASATLYYAVVPSDPPGSENGVLCGRLEVEHDGWIGLAIATDTGTEKFMDGADAIIGVPGVETVLKYDLTPLGATPMSDDKQTLTDTSIAQENGKTIMEFAKLLVEDGENPILEEGENIFLHARGGSEISYHTSRIVFRLNFDTPVATAILTKDCTKELCDNELAPGYSLSYKINIPDDTTADVCDKCTISMELSYSGEAWVGVAFSTDGQMIGSEAVIGLPGEDKVQKYNLEGKSDAAVTPMPEDQQTLSETSIEVKDGQTIMKFTKIMSENGEIEISTGDNTFLWAHGSSNTLGYHSDRASFQLNLSAPPTDQPDQQPAAPTPAAAPTPDQNASTEAALPAKDCTKDFCDNELAPGYSLRYKINVPDGTTADVCDKCTISMELDYAGQAWVAVAFSTNGQMVGSEAVIGLPEENKVEKYKLAGKDVGSVTPMPEAQQTLSETSIETENGRTIMKFTKIMKEDGEIEITTGDNTFLWAYGTGNALGYHASRASFDLNLSSGASEELAVPNKSAWLAHGIMAFCAWGVFVPFAVQSSLLRDLLPKGPLWFKLHRGFNSTAFAFFVVIFAIAVAFTSKEGGTHFNNDHQKMGLAMFIMAVFQVSGGVFRPHLPGEGEDKSAVRKGWEVGHRVLGVTLLACGFWQMREGIALFAIKYSVTESGEGSLSIAYWVWIGVMSALIVLGGGYFKLKSRDPSD